MDPVVSQMPVDVDVKDLEEIERLLAEKKVASQLTYELLNADQ